jgi:hypothetical protein
LQTFVTILKSSFSAYAKDLNRELGAVWERRRLACGFMNTVKKEQASRLRSHTAWRP